MNRSVEILLVEDNPGDIKLTSKLLEGLKTPYRLNVVRDGVEALAYLLREEPYPNVPFPDLILLDLNLPRKDGRELLRDIKANPRTKRVPVLVLTTSGADADVLMSYELHANCYIKKPVSLEEFRHILSVIEAFWLGVNVLPPRADE